MNEIKEVNKEVIKQAKQLIDAGLEGYPNYYNRKGKYIMKYELEIKRFEARHYPFSGWSLVETETRIVNEQFYKNTIDPMALKFFRSLGGTERVNNIAGGKTRCTSTSPNGEDRIVRTFTPIYEE